ncbi:MAG: hypothetical protein LBQ69_04430 [Treponema sp.]|nr:hypothetical protein [Treponema sp.]
MNQNEELAKQDADFFRAFAKDKRDTDAIDAFLDCELLVIDDLGAEPQIKNVTQEHLCNIINERLQNGRPFIVTTNLSPAQIVARYDQRIASRILCADTSTLINFSGPDRRITAK